MPTETGTWETMASAKGAVVATEAEMIIGREAKPTDFFLGGFITSKALREAKREAVAR